MIEISMHTDNWRCLSGSFEQACEAAKKFGLEHIEFGVVDGQDFIQGSQNQVGQLPQRSGKTTGEIGVASPAAHSGGHLRQQQRGHLSAPSHSRHPCQETPCLRQWTQGHA